MQIIGQWWSGYMNDRAVKMDKINLDKFPLQHQGIIREMQQIGQWWSGIRLRHTSTFGIRIYRRGSMLINHVDRSSTHIISAVLQIGQEVDEDGGWPPALFFRIMQGLQKSIYNLGR